METRARPFNRYLQKAMPGLLLLLLCLTAGAGARADSAAIVDGSLDNALQALKAGDAIILMRHALAPGGGDPSHFDINDCSTQRNLSDTGRDQASRIGQWLQTNLLPAKTAIWTSQWCRCAETAEKLELGEPIALPPLNSFFSRRENEPAQTQDFLQWLADKAKSQEPPVAHILVTHQVNITAWTAVYPASGEIVIASINDQRLPLTVLAKVRID